ncbi:MAG TPA: hypothetical protein VFK31_09490 [Rhodanobacteraceae bacterium]|nr:hypothetical protein [Rhodanobacteraceae bacterium]
MYIGTWGIPLFITIIGALVAWFWPKDGDDWGILGLFTFGCWLIVSLVSWLVWALL